jgi:glycosyltransferase involved in cell wall biosynthesis
VGLPLLRVLHVPFTFAPDPVGGTEVYVEGLAKELRSCDIESIIAAPSCHGADEAYDYCGLRVRRYRSALDSTRMLRELYGEGDHEAGLAFARILDEETPDIVHMHAFTRAVSIQLVRASKQRRIPVVFTYHTPTVSCQRGTLMLWGTKVCDGVVETRRCTDCSLENEGLPRWASMPLSYVPSFVAKLLENADLSGGLWTGLRMADLIRTRCNAFQALVSEVDGIIALKEWVRTLLIQNGVPTSKITVSPHGLVAAGDKSGPVVDAEQVPLRVAFFGRSDYAKGVDTLIKAVKAAPELKIELHLYGVIQGGAAHAYHTKLESLAAEDPRISFLAPVPHERVVPLLSGYHLLAVPSRWMETGPLVILESFAAGTPVIGSNLGGIAEWVRHGENGILVDFDDVLGWRDAFRRCAENRHVLVSLRRGVRPPRGMRQVAHEMAHIYRNQVIPTWRSSDQCALR